MTAVGEILWGSFSQQSAVFFPVYSIFTVASSNFISMHIRHSDIQTLIKYLAVRMQNASLIPGVHLQMDYCLLWGQIWCLISSWKSGTECQAIVLHTEMKGSLANEHLPASIRTPAYQQILELTIAWSSCSDQKDLDVNLDGECGTALL